MSPIFCSSIGKYRVARVTRIKAHTIVGGGGRRIGNLLRRRHEVCINEFNKTFPRRASEGGKNKRDDRDKYAVPRMLSITNNVLISRFNGVWICLRRARQEFVKLNSTHDANRRCNESITMATIKRDTRGRRAKIVERLFNSLEEITFDFQGWIYDGGWSRLFGNIKRNINLSAWRQRCCVHREPPSRFLQRERSI